MSGLDLNATPTEDVEMDDVEPLFCTQVVPEPVVGESQDPDLDVHEAVVGNSDRYSGRGHEHNGEQATSVGNQNFPTTTFPTDTTTNPDFAEGGSDGEAIGITEEILSSPQEPFIGMRFDTLADARAHYHAYAAKLGFSIKNNTSKKKAHTNELEKQQFVCNKYRAPKTEEQIEQEKMAFTEDVSPVQLDDDNDEEQEAGPSKRKKTASKFGVKRKRETIKQTKCRARMFVKLINNKWEVTFFIAEHNHPMIVKPSLIKYLRSHRGIPRDEKEFLRCLHNCNLDTGRMMEVMSEFYGEDCIVPYGPRTISNLRSSFRSENKELDISDTLEYFKELQQKDPEFFYEFSFDSENRVEHIFWVDSLARRAYAEAYHDCILFDTTFCTNIFSMPFAPFIGINRHEQSFMLGCGFLRDEKEDNFEWLFRVFLKAMKGKQPTNIITDQDWAMRNAISAIFPLCCHRNCRWHIMKKANEKLGSFLGRHPGLAEDFNECVDESMTVEEFEANWAELIQKWELSQNETFNWLKSNAHTWVPCYFRDRFFPFLQSTQRSEGSNTVLKRCINPKKFNQALCEAV
ncbi:protein FAR1-RELATED SEQUENCE 5-like [Lolium perenne]|uniref:protein FAR1-RELATED SEQUENCE 5-like n=1 Tax=Lolium perenne TaxID=4522 RepID=UPI0021F5F23C|nr:protein FAR1-RELATED SEQUENCE 5-like [Lolium perenne]